MLCMKNAFSLYYFLLRRRPWFYLLLFSLSLSFLLQHCLAIVRTCVARGWNFVIFPSLSKVLRLLFIFPSLVLFRPVIFYLEINPRTNFSIALSCCCSSIVVAKRNFSILFLAILPDFAPNDGQKTKKTEMLRSLSEIKIPPEKKQHEPANQVFKHFLKIFFRHLPSPPFLCVSMKWKNSSFETFKPKTNASPRQSNVKAWASREIKIAFYSETIYLRVFHAFLISINFINRFDVECRKAPHRRSRRLTPNQECCKWSHWLKLSFFIMP